MQEYNAFKVISVEIESLKKKKESAQNDISYMQSKMELLSREILDAENNILFAEHLLEKLQSEQPSSSSSSIQKKGMEIDLDDLLKGDKDELNTNQPTNDMQKKLKRTRRAPVIRRERGIGIKIANITAEFLFDKDSVPFQSIYENAKKILSLEELPRSTVRSAIKADKRFVSDVNRIGYYYMEKSEGGMPYDK